MNGLRPLHDLHPHDVAALLVLEMLDALLQCVVVPKVNEGIGAMRAKGVEVAAAHQAQL